MKIKNERKYVIRRLLVVGILIGILLFINNIYKKQPKWEFVEYTVQPGDTIWYINQHLETGLNWRETNYYIDIDNPDYDGCIHPGDTLIFRINVNNI